jgi:hypothetical protein
MGSSPIRRTNLPVAQLEERPATNREACRFDSCREGQFQGVAQLAERLLWEQEDGSSSLSTLTTSLPLGSVGRAPSSEGGSPRFDPASGYQLTARGQGGYGPVCKTGETGSTPVRASNLLQWLEWIGARFLIGSTQVRILLGAPIACVAHRMSARVLSGMTLVRFQSQAPIGRANCGGPQRRLLSGRSVRR